MAAERDRHRAAHAPRRFRAAAALASGAVALVAASACAGTPVHTRPSATASNSLTAPDGGRLRVIEHGFSMERPTTETATNQIAYAVILENTSKTLEADNTRLTIQLTDAGGTLVFTAMDSTDPANDLVPRIYPGQRIGIGLSIVTHRPASAHLTVTTMQVGIGRSTWSRPRESRHVTVSDVTARRSANGYLDISYATTAGNDTGPQYPRLDLLFRDTTGKLIGGGRLDHTHLPTWPPGRTTHQLHLSPQEWTPATPTSADLTKTEIYASMDGG
jgi:hypothetical protein